MDFLKVQSIVLFLIFGKNTPFSGFDNVLHTTTSTINLCSDFHPIFLLPKEYLDSTLKSGLPWKLNGKEYTCQCRRWVGISELGRFPVRKKWQPTPVFLPGKSLRQRSLVGYHPYGCKPTGQNLETKQQQSKLKILRSSL